MTAHSCLFSMACGDLATWASAVVSLLAALGTLAAVLVALSSSRRAIALTREMRQDERRENQDLANAESVRAEIVRRLRAKAYAAATVDVLVQAKLAFDAALRWYESEAIRDSKKKCQLAEQELMKIDVAVLQQALTHVEVFENPLGKMLARLTVYLSGVQAAAERRHQFLSDNAGGILDIPVLALACRRGVLHLRHQAQYFYDVADIAGENRYLTALSGEEMAVYASQAFPIDSAE